MNECLTTPQLKNKSAIGCQSFCWVPNHIGIRGNEKANSVSKSALAR